MKQMVLSILTKDRPGVIADVTGAIFRLQGDLADLNQSVLWGYLTMILIVNFPDTVTKATLAAAIAASEGAADFQVSVKELAAPLTSGPPVPKETFIMTVQAANRGGLVYQVSRFCCERGINILDLTTTLRDDRYVMALQLDLTGIVSLAALREDLSAFADTMGLSLTLQHNDLFQATEEVRLH
ncbi:MAG: hypothetical protein LBH14_01060 [Desulfobulbaceae bacterium]|jgi:glycine cleavage system transcriptional repressor|nr:hypothetical protein [Desulfobulbaceae bacterium]